MKTYMQNYLKWLEEQLQKAEQLRPEQVSALRKETLVQIQFMQHERLVHFLVVILIALAFFLTMGFYLYFKSVGLVLLCLLLLVLLVPYIGHYYFLENTTQKFYVLYNRLSALDDQTDYPNTDKMAEF